MEQINELPIVAEIQLMYRPVISLSDRPQVLKSTTAYELLYHTWDKDTLQLYESFKLILLSANKRALGITTISNGGTMSALVDPALVFATALKANSRSLILAHNHPSGNLSPSEADKCLTQRLKEGGALLNIGIDDHIIVSKEGFFSFEDQGLL